MRKTTYALATAMILSLAGGAMAQTTAPGSAEKNMNNPGSVKSNSEKSMERGSMPATPGTAAPGTMQKDGMSTSGHSSGGSTSSTPTPAR